MSDNFHIEMNDLEIRIMVQALADLKDKQKAENKSYDFLDSMILKLCDARENSQLKQYEER